MRVTQGCFSFLPDLNDEQVAAQIEYCLSQNWSRDPHPRNTYWDMWGNPMFDLKDAAGVMMEIRECRKAHPEHYIRINAFDSTRGWETVRMSFIATRPKVEPDIDMTRREVRGRTQGYSHVTRY
jgi:ribulose-bisphosphate carboxylase small chain